jgi:hypothetical protein
MALLPKKENREIKCHRTKNMNPKAQVVGHIKETVLSIGRKQALPIVLRSICQSKMGELSSLKKRNTRFTKFR